MNTWSPFWPVASSVSCHHSKGLADADVESGGNLEHRLGKGQGRSFPPNEPVPVIHARKGTNLGVGAMTEGGLWEHTASD